MFFFIPEFERAAKIRKIAVYTFICTLSCKTEHKTQLSFSQRQEILKCGVKIFELQKCGHSGKSNYGLNLSIILIFLTIYGLEKSQCDGSNGLNSRCKDHVNIHAFIDTALDSN